MPLQLNLNSEGDALSPLAGKTVAVIGFGNQGHAHALNLRDAGIRVVVGNRPDSANGRRAAQLGFEPLETKQAVSRADLVIIGLPDQVQPDVFTTTIQPALRPGSTIGFIHGFCVRFDLIRAPEGIGVVMVAPKGPGRTLRERFEAGQGLPCLVAVHQESSKKNADALALAWAHGIGGARAGIIRTTFKDETDTDLFGEQTVLCGGMTWLILAAFETLVNAGYPPELAYLECCHEVKQIADLVHDGGISAMMARISNTAEFGAYAVGPKLVDASIRDRMKAVLGDIQSGAFARALREDYAKGFPWFRKQKDMISRHPIEPAGAAVRSLMPWLGQSDPAQPA